MWWQRNALGALMSSVVDAPAAAMTTKTTVSFIVLLACILQSSAASSRETGRDCILKNRSEDQACDIGNGPLTRCERYREFAREDKRLNDAYAALQRSLNNSAAQQLRATQRSWIKWRDQTCEDAEERGGCNNGVCAGVEQDGCVVKLTRVRAAELTHFLADPASAARSRFSYAKKYEGWLTY